MLRRGDNPQSEKSSQNLAQSNRSLTAPQGVFAPNGAKKTKKSDKKLTRANSD